MSEERGAAWRRHKESVKSRCGTGSLEAWKPEKNWKMVYLRSEKLKRAKQLGFHYPRKSQRQLLEMEYFDES